MGRLKVFTVGLLVGLLPVNCAGVVYRYYGLHAESYEGQLLGPKEKDDLPLSYCQPTEQNKSPCVVLFADEWFRAKAELLQLRSELKECQRNGGGTPP